MSDGLRPRAFSAATACFVFLTLSTARAEEAAWKPSADGSYRTREIREKGQVVRAEVDRNGDGRADSWTDFEGGLRKKGAEDHDLDGRFERTFSYDGKGGLLQDLTDTNGDGKPDRFYFFPHGNRSAVIREADRNFDGKVDSRNFALWDEKRVSVIPEGNRITRIPMPGYRAAWEERDDNYDGVIDYYKDWQDAKKTRMGQKIDPRPAEAVEEEASASDGGGSSDDPVGTQARVKALNERYGLS